VNSAIIPYVPPGILWMAAIYTFRSVRRRPGNPGIWFYWLTVVVLASALTVLLPPAYVAIDRLLGVPNLARFIGNGLGLVACWTVQRFLVHVSGTDRPVRGLIGYPGWILVIVLALMGGLFAEAPINQESVDFMKRYGTAPFVLEYRLALFAYLGLTLVNLSRFSWRYAAVTDWPTQRLGLRLVSAGASTGLGYVAAEVLYAVALKLGRSFPVHQPALVFEVIVSLALILIAVGSTMPMWGPRLGIPWLCRWAGDYRSLWRLYPLWRALYSASPHIALMPARSLLAEALTVRDLGFRLYRRTIEIQDGRLVLRPHVLPGAAPLARDLCRRAGLPETEVGAVVEAARLRAALSAMAAGLVGEDDTPALVSLGGSDVASNVAALERVAYHFRRSPIVSTVAAQVRREFLGNEPGSVRSTRRGGGDG